MGVPVVLADLETIDEQLYKNSCWVRDNHGVEKLGLTFSMITETNQVVDLKPNGRQEDVTDANKSEFLTLMVRYCLLDTIADQLEAMMAGLFVVRLSGVGFSFVRFAIVNDFSDEDRGRLMQFATGSCHVPPEGFEALTSANGEVKPFTILLVGRGVPPAGLCPRAHHRINRIDLPAYESKAELERYLTLVIQMEISSANQSATHHHTNGLYL